VARQQRRVEADAAARRDREHLRAEQPGPPDDDKQVRGKPPDVRNPVGGVDVGAAPDGDLVSPGERLQIHVAGGPQPVLPGRRDYRGDLGRAVEQSVVFVGPASCTAPTNTTRPGDGHIMVAPLR
jgi:hypothetical protein